MRHIDISNRHRFGVLAGQRNLFYPLQNGNLRLLNKKHCFQQVVWQRIVFAGIFLMSLLLFLAGDIETNPGPALHRLKSSFA